MSVLKNEIYHLCVHLFAVQMSDARFFSPEWCARLDVFLHMFSLTNTGVWSVSPWHECGFKIGSNILTALFFTDQNPPQVQIWSADLPARLKVWQLSFLGNQVNFLTVRWLRDGIEFTFFIYTVFLMLNVFCSNSLSYSVLFKMYSYVL